VCEVSRRKRANVAVNVKFTTVSNTLIEAAGNKQCAEWKSFVIRKKRIIYRRDNRVPSITPKLYYKQNVIKFS